MSETKHTPGPWEVGMDDEMDGIPFIEVDAGPCPSPQYRSVCHVQPTIDTEADSFEIDEEVRANARLIAAAPDMLAALQNIENDGQQVPDHAWRLIQAAIAKATGAA